MVHLIDRRFNSKNKSTVNRQRFLRRYRRQIRESVNEKVRQRSITNTTTGEKISIPVSDTHEPTFHHGAGGRASRIFPGNKEFVVGDRISRPSGGGSGQGANASDEGEGIDEFVFNISQKEFLDILFEDMELPNLTKRQLSGLEEIKFQRAGFAFTGGPNNIDILRSLKSATSRRIALTAAKRAKLKELEAQMETEQNSPVPNLIQLNDLKQQIELLREQISRIPYLDDIDIRYRRFEKKPAPHSKAVMFCLMDVSGSMDQYTKDLAKRFFILLYLFLHRKYEKTDIVFIRHHTTAKEVDEENFFYSRETGGTVVSTAIHMMKEIIEARYPVSEWNIYGAQASDGDNWPEDNLQCINLLTALLPMLQYYAYIEISSHGSRELWKTYEQLDEKFNPVFAMRHIRTPADIYPVFKKLFQKQTS
jgi:uncharacterized protein